jgi:hypothetical protein
VLFVLKDTIFMRRHVGFLKDGSITETISISGRLTKMEDVFLPLFACLLACLLN